MQFQKLSVTRGDTVNLPKSRQVTYEYLVSFDEGIHVTPFGWSEAEEGDDAPNHHVLLKILQSADAKKPVNGWHWKMSEVA